MGEIATILAPVFVAAALGWGWVRTGRAYDRDLISGLISDLGAPCLIFSSLTRIELDPALMARVVGIAFLAMGSFAVVGACVLRAFRIPIHTFLAPVTFGNTGNMGLPLALFAFGENGLALGVCYFSVSAFLQFTAGVWLWSGRLSWVDLVRTPMAWAAVAAAVVVSGDLAVPVWLANSTQLLGGFAIPLMLITLGASLAEVRVGMLRRTLGLSALRLGMGFTGGVVLAEIFELDGLARGVLILQTSMPPAVFNYLFALRYKRSPEEVASLVVGCTLLAFLLLPLLLTYLI